MFLLVSIFTARCYAERGYATVSRLSVRLSVTIRYDFHIGWNTSKIISRPNSLRPMRLVTPTWAIWCNGNTPKFGETRGGVGKSGVLKHKSGNISETCKDRGKGTMEGLLEVTNAVSSGTIPDPIRLPFPQDWAFATSIQNVNRYYLRNG